MKIHFPAIVILLFCIDTANAQIKFAKPAKVDYDAFAQLTNEVKEYRKDRLITLTQFLWLSKQENVIILDTRSDTMFRNKHIKGAVHLNFSDFTQENLAKIIPSPDTKILIYCNNNFFGDQVNFATKAVQPKVIKRTDIKPITLALNIPTFINLYGYGYRNVYELKELVSVFNSHIEFEGIAVAQPVL